MEALFNQLKRELLSPDNTMEDSFNLLNELRIATERNFALKKMFWKVGNCINWFGLYECLISLSTVFQFYMYRFSRSFDEKTGFTTDSH